MSHPTTFTDRLLDLLFKDGNLALVLSFGLAGLVVLTLATVAVLQALRSIKMRKTERETLVDIETKVPDIAKPAIQTPAE